jgi:hypothetical protein
MQKKRRIWIQQSKHWQSPKNSIRGHQWAKGLVSLTVLRFFESSTPAKGAKFLKNSARSILSSIKWNIFNRATFAGLGS